MAGVVMVPKERTGGLVGLGNGALANIRSAQIMPSVVSTSTMLATANGTRGSTSRSVRAR